MHALKVTSVSHAGALTKGVVVKDYGCERLLEDEAGFDTTTISHLVF